MQWIVFSGSTVGPLLPGLWLTEVNFDALSRSTQGRRNVLPRHPLVGRDHQASQVVESPVLKLVGQRLNIVFGPASCPPRRTGRRTCTICTKRLRPSLRRYGFTTPGRQTRKCFCSEFCRIFAERRRNQGPLMPMKPMPTMPMRTMVVFPFLREADSRIIEDPHAFPLVRRRRWSSSR
jgi:hypothetical protein